MRRIVAWCLDRASVVLLATVLVLLAGAYGTMQLRQQFFPDVDFPFLIAKVEAEGLSPEQVDQQVAGTMSSVAKSLNGVRRVTTVSSEGEARIYAELDFGTDTAALQDEFSQAVQQADLPDGVSAPEYEGGFSEQAVFNVALVGDDIEALTKQADEWVSEIAAVDGVARVDVDGTATQRIIVELTAAAQRAGVTPAMVAEALRERAASLPGGSAPVTLPDGGGEAQLPIVVEGAGTAADVAALKRAQVTTPTGPQRLSDIATVTAATGNVDGFARTNGKPSIALAIYRTSDANEVEVVDEADAILDDARKQLGKDNVVTIFETASEVRKSIKGLLLEAGLGALFAVFVIFLFLRSGRATLVTAVAIPTSMVFGMLAGWMFGLTLNIITLAGLTIAIGRVIDDGIVVLENIVRHLERGEPRRTATIDGTAEVARAITSSTLATAAVFMPIGLVGGFISEIFLSFSIIVSCALVASLLVAVTVVPTLGYLVLGRGVKLREGSTRLAELVTPATRWGLRYPIVIVPVAFIVFLGSIAAVAFGAVPIQFLPGSGTQQIFGTATLPPGTTAESAEQLLAPLEKEIAGIEDIADYQIGWGGGALQTGDPGQAIGAATYFLTVGDEVDASKVEKELREFGAEQYGEGSFEAVRIEQGPPAGTFQATVRADDTATLQKGADEIVELLKKRSDTAEVSTDAARDLPQLTVSLKDGAPISASELSAALLAATSIQTAGETADGATISVHPNPQIAANPIAVPFATASGTTATIGEIATAQQQSRPAFVNRNEEGQLTAYVNARLLGEDTRGAIQDIKTDIEDLKLDGIDVTYEGEAEFVDDMLKDLGLAMIIAVVLVYLIMVVFFGSLLHPLTILSPIMFSLIGSLGALILTGQAIGLPAMIGQLLLIGIVVANSILLVDTALHMKHAGLNREAALITSAQQRVRPVLMTALATVAALLPLATGISGEGGIISQSLGTVVVGGLLLATLLTLVLVPSVTFWTADESTRAVTSRHSRTLALVLSVVLGIFGFDRLYLRQGGYGLLKMLTLGGLGIWWIVDIILIALERARDIDGHTVRRRSTSSDAPQPPVDDRELASASR